MRPQEAATTILNGFWDLSIPVNPVEIAEKMGIKVYLDSDMGTHAGFYDEPAREITINENDPPHRQRFSVAHELGHAVLGHGSSPRQNDVTYNTQNYIPKEAQANLFAAELIMPREAMQVMVEMRGLKLDELCKTFSVSPTAMRIRLDQLGYI